MKFISLYTNLNVLKKISYVFTSLFCIRRYIIAFLTIFMNSYVALNIVVYILLQLGTISMFLHFKPMLTKMMNYTEIINEGVILASVYYMMIFTNWM